MICQVCKDAAAKVDGEEYLLTLEETKALHATCKGGTHCDCQHKPTLRQSDGSLAQRRN